MPSIVAILWMIFQPLLFGLIGAEVDIAKIDGSTVGRYLPKSELLHVHVYVNTKCPSG